MEDDLLLRESITLPPLGRVFNTLLSAKHHHLQNPSPGPITRALVALLQHAEFALQTGSHLDKLFVPLVEHVVKSRERHNRKQVLSIVQWLLQNLSVGAAVADGLSRILQSKGFDHHVKLGCCVILRDLVQQKVTMTGLPQSGTWDGKLVPLFNCIPDLLSIMSDPSVKGLPTRLSISAADSIILLSKYAAECTALWLEEKEKGSTADGHQIELISTSDSVSVHVPESETSWSDSDDGLASTSGRQAVVGKEMLLWEQLDRLLELIFTLKKWNEKSRPLHAQGLRQIERCLETLVHFRTTQQQKGGESDLFVLVSVLSTCWNRYSILMLLESSSVHLDSKVLLPQWLEGLQHSMQMEGQEEGNDTFRNTTRKVDEIRIFFLTCLALLLGRLGGAEMEGLVLEFGAELLHALFGQLRAKDAEVVDLAVAILRALLFQTQLANPTLLRMETIAPSLIDLLDEKDSTSRAIVVLIADYFAINPGAPELEKLFGILGSGNTAQRQNALCVISELLNSLSSSEDKLTNTVRQDVAIHLLKRLGDVELTNRIEVAQLFAKLDPQFVLPALVQHLYSRDEKVRSAASASIVSVLKGHNDQCAVVSVLLDCSSNMIQNEIFPVNPGQIGLSTSGGSSPDVGRIMRLIPAWANKVKEWDRLIDVILQKVFADPSNPVMPRFLSQISQHLSDNVEAVLKHVLAFMAEQPKMTEELVLNLRNGDSFQTTQRLDAVVFERLSPLLVLKVLHLKAFDDASCPQLYGTKSENGNLCEQRCITDFLIERACGVFESHDIRKLSAELLGRLLPGIILPLLTKHLEDAVENQHTLQARSCIFALCSSLWLRGKESLYHQSMVHIQGLLAQVLLQPCLSTDEETFKTQHGCIDCFAMMICAELASAKEDSGSHLIHRSTFQNDGLPIIEELREDVGLKRQNGDHPQRDHSILSSVISCIIGQHQNVPFLPSLPWAAVEIYPPERTGQQLTIQSAFRLCMANVLISATQKIATLQEKQSYVSQMIPPVTRFVQIGMDSEIKTACLQILFTAVHNLKETIIPYAVDFFTLSLGMLRSKGSTEERKAAARLIASLLSSDDHVTREMVPYLSEALMTLESISRMDSSSELRAFCEQLLNCIMPEDSVVQPF